MVDGRGCTNASSKLCHVFPHIDLYISSDRELTNTNIEFKFMITRKVVFKSLIDNESKYDFQIYCIYYFCSKDWLEGKVCQEETKSYRGCWGDEHDVSGE